MNAQLKEKDSVAATGMGKEAETAKAFSGDNFTLGSQMGSNPWYAKKKHSGPPPAEYFQKSKNPEKQHKKHKESKDEKK